MCRTIVNKCVVVRGPERENSALKQGGAESLFSFLERAKDCCLILGEGFEKYAEGFQGLYDRGDRERKLHLAVLGQFKRGKSSFLNALIGEEVLPVGVLPVTAIPTYISHGERFMASIAFKNGARPSRFVCESPDEICKILESYVSELENPENRKQVSRADVFLPSPVLLDGIVLIDLPGIGSTLLHNTEITSKALPRCDATILVTSVDPPITEEEVELLKRVTPRVPCIGIVLNKVDYLLPEECAVSKRFLSETVMRHAKGMEGLPLFCVSSKRAIGAKHRNDGEEVSDSGLKAVEIYLGSFIVEEGPKLLRASIESKALALMDDVLTQVNLRIRLLEAPLEEIESSIDFLRNKVKEVDLETLSLQDILNSGCRRARDFLEAEAKALRDNAFEFLMGKLLEGGASARWGSSSEELQLRIMEQELPSYFREKGAEVMARVEERVKSVLLSHERRLDILCQAVSRIEEELPSVSALLGKERNCFVIVRRPYWTANKDEISVTPVPRFFRRALMVCGRTIRAQLEQRVWEVVMANVEELRWSLLQSINETFRLFERDFLGRLREMRKAFLVVIAEAEVRRDQSVGETEKERARFLKEAGRMKRLRSGLIPGGEGFEERMGQAAVSAK